MNRLHAGQTHAVNAGLQKLDALSERVQQGDVTVRTGQLERHSREACAAAYIKHTLTGEILRRQQGDTVQKMLFCDLVRLGDAGQIHDLIGLHHALGKILQLCKAGFRCVQLPFFQSGT